jgi:hypothetical protein
MLHIQNVQRSSDVSCLNSSRRLMPEVPGPAHREKDGRLNYSSRDTDGQSVKIRE